MGTDFSVALHGIERGHGVFSFAGTSAQVCPSDLNPRHTCDKNRSLQAYLLDDGIDQYQRIGRKHVARLVGYNFDPKRDPQIAGIAGVGPIKCAA